MKVKLSIAAALSHKAKLIILDDACGSLDPVVRSEILDIFMDFIQEEDHTETGSQKQQKQQVLRPHQILP